MNLEHFNKMSSGLFSHLQNYPPSAGIFMDHHHRQPDVSSFPQDAARRYRPTSNVELKPPRGPIRTSNHHSSPCNLNRDVQDSHCRPSPDPGLREAALPNTAVSAAAAAAAAAAVTAAPPPPQHQQAQAQNQQQQQQQQQQPPSSRPNHNGASTPRANHGPSTSRANHVTGPGGQSEPRKSKTKRVMDPGDGRYFPCPRCSKIFVSQRNLDSHLKTHTNLRPLKCLDCGKCFTLRNTLICHMRVHTKERPYTCSICFKSFTQASSLKAHVICVHTKQYPHQCTQCGRGFISPSQRREHDVRFHSKKQQQPPMN